jgi:hypothetical protein
MKLAYADPPYYGYGHLYNDTDAAATRDYDNLDYWADLIADLSTQYDGWALSMTSGNLHDILPLCPPESRIAAWVKPFAAFKANVRIAYTWEPVVFMPGRDRSSEGAPVGRDHLAEGITMQRGLTGVKPDRFNAWVMDLLGWMPGDEFTDFFPGSGGMDRVVAKREGMPTEGQLDLFDMAEA